MTDSTESGLGALRWDEAGLVTVVAQDRHTGEVRMLAHATREAVEATLSTGTAWFFSRSRQRLWKKGEESGNVLAVSEVWADCDGDALLYLVDPAGPSCHTGRPTCFFRRLGADADESAFGRPTLAALGGVLVARAASNAKASYTRSLLDGGPERIGAKLREEADELATAVADESDGRVVSEAADVIYHLMVALLARGVDLRDVEAELGRRFGQSGHAEKASR